MRTKYKKQWMLRVMICMLAWMQILPTGALGDLSRSLFLQLPDGKVISVLSAQ